MDIGIHEIIIIIIATSHVNRCIPLIQGTEPTNFDEPTK